MDKSKQLQNLKEEVFEDTTLPLREVSTQLVFGVGNPDSELLFIGESPGYWEDQKGEPFVGNSGKLLDKLLALIGLDRTKVFITNVTMYRPPENRDPEPSELAAFEKYLDRLIKIIEPRVIVTLGRFSMHKFLPDVKITQVHGQVYNMDWNGLKLTVVPMFHPSAALRGTTVMNMVKQDFLSLGGLLKKLNIKS